VSPDLFFQLFVKMELEIVQELNRRFNKAVTLVVLDTKNGLETLDLLGEVFVGLDPEQKFVLANIRYQNNILCVDGKETDQTNWRNLNACCHF